MLHSGIHRLAEKSRRRASIVDSADRLYAEHGWELLTVDEVARHAQLSRTLVYVHFRDKADLHLAIVERALSLLFQRLCEAEASQKRGLDKVDAMVRAFAALEQERPHYFDACSRFQILGNPRARPAEHELACLHIESCILQILAEAIAGGYQDGSIRGDLGDARLVALTLWAFMHGSLQIAHTKESILAESFSLTRRMLQSSSITS